MKIKSLILDLGGVVASNAPRLFLREFAVKHNLTIDEVVPAFKQHFPKWILGKMSEEEFWKGFLQELNLPEAEESFVKYCKEQLRLFAIVNDDLLLMLQDVEIVGKLKLGLASNCPKELGQHFEEKYELGLTFDTMIYSGVEGIGKPDKLFFEKAAENLGVNAEHCIYIDDKEKNVKAAEEAGMTAIKFTTVSELVGELEKYIKLTEDKKKWLKEA